MVSMITSSKGLQLLNFCHPDQGPAKALFSLLNIKSYDSNTPTTSSGGSMFGSATSSSSACVGTSVFRQSSTVSSSVFISSVQSHATQSLPFHQGSKAATIPSTGIAVSPSVFGLWANRIILHVEVSTLEPQPHLALQVLLEKSKHARCTWIEFLCKYVSS